MAKARTLDMTDVGEGRLFNKKRQPEGDYPATVTKVEDAKKKDDPSKKMWLFTIKAGKGGIYPFYCGFGPKELWKIKNLWIACGVAVPSKISKLDPNKLVNKTLGVTLEDDEYDGKAQSSIGATFPESELEGLEEEADDSDEPKSKGKKHKDKGKDKGKKGKKGKVKDDELEALDVEEV